MDDGVSDATADQVVIAGYRDITPLGTGGFSTVYRAIQEPFDRVVAVKVLALELRDARSQQRFLGEASVIGPLSDHPNIVHVLDSGFTAQGRPYITTEHMARGSLADRLAHDGPLPLELVLRVGVKVAGAVAAMHALDVMHRDIKPENILMSHFDEPGLADFGIATVLAGRVATSGTFSSTPVHAPPEVLEGQGSRPATDIWSLASSLYTLLAGRAPFVGERGEGMYPMMQRILTDPLPPIDRDDVPTELHDILATAMAKDPLDRYASALLFGRVLQGLQEELGLPVTEMIAPQAQPGGGSTTITRRGRETLVLAVSGVAELAAARASGAFDLGRVTGRPATASPDPPPPAPADPPVGSSSPASSTVGASRIEPRPPAPDAPTSSPGVSPVSSTATNTASWHVAPVSSGETPVSGERVSVPPHLDVTVDVAPVPPATQPVPPDRALGASDVVPVPIGPAGSRTTVPPVPAFPPTDRAPAAPVPVPPGAAPPGTPPAPPRAAPPAAPPPATPLPAAPVPVSPGAAPPGTPPAPPLAAPPAAPPPAPPLTPVAIVAGSAAPVPAGLASSAPGPPGAARSRDPGPTLAPFTSSAHRARRRSILLAVAGVVALALVASAILFLARRGGDGDNGGGASGVPGAAARGGTLVPPPAAGCRPVPARAAPAAGTPRTGGVLRFGLRDDGDGWDPRRAGFNSSSLLEASSLYEPVAAFDEQGVIHPWLAESITPNADATEFAITVRPNIRFHDGRALDAEALRANLDEAKSNSFVGLAFLTVSGLSVRDPRTVVVSMNRPWPSFPNVLAGQFAYLKSPALIGTDAAQTRPIGTGPFAFKAWKPGQSLELVRNDDYWGGPAGTGVAHLDGIEFEIIPDDAARERALEARELDAADAMDPAVIPQLASLPHGESTGTMEHVLLNTSKPPFDNIAARRLLAAATDRQTLAAGMQSDLIRPASSPLPSTGPWCIDDADPPAFDPAHARRLADEYRNANGHPLTFDLSVPSYGDLPVLGKQLAEMWATVGIEAHVAVGDRIAVTWGYVEGKYTAGLHAPRPTDDPDSLYDQFHTGPAGPVGKGPQLNVTRVSDPRIDEALDAGRTATDPAARREAYRTLVRDLDDVVPVIYLLEAPHAIATSPQVHGADELVTPGRNMARPWATTVWME